MAKKHNPFNFAVFKGPKFSVYSIDHGNRIAMPFGDLVPIYWDYLGPNERIECNVAHLIRVAPMIFPVMEDIEVNIDAFAVPLDAIGAAYKNPYIYRDFFNLNKNIDGSLTLPETPTAGGDNIGNLISEQAINGFKGTIWDYMGLPTFPNFRKAFRQALNSAELFTMLPTEDDFGVASDYGNSGVGFPVGIGRAGAPVNIGQVLWKTQSGLRDFVDGKRSDTAQSQRCGFPAFWLWLVVKYPVGLNVMSSAPVDVAAPVDVSIQSGYNPLIWLGRSTSSTTSARNPYAPVVARGSNPIGDLEPVVRLGFSGDFSSYTSDSGNPLIQKTLVTDYILGISSGKSYQERVFEVYYRDISSLMDEYFNEMLYLLFSYGLKTSNAGNTLNLTSPLTDYITSYLDNAITDSVDVPEVGNFDQQTKLSRLGAIPYYPFDCYWKIVSDWYLNTSFDDPEDWYLQKIMGSSTDPFDRDESARLSLFGSPFKRNWKNDYFTSAFPTPQVGQGVTISDGDSIVDLRNKNTWQKIKEKLLYAGKRWRDVWYAMTGSKVSLSEADMSIPLATYNGHINISSILQTSESSQNSPQAQYAGTGISADGSDMHVNYVAESPTVILFLASIRPRATYYQGIHKKLLRNNVYEYDWSDFSNIGEEPIYNYEIFADAPGRASRTTKQASDVFGWTRRFASFMFTPSEVHGDLIDTYDFVHLARQFDDVPSLGQNFVAVNAAEDNLNRIFADTSDTIDKFICHFVFSGNIVRSIPKYVRYDL